MWLAVRFTHPITKTMKIGCGTVNFRTLPLEQALRHIADAGYEYVETQATAPFCPHVDVDRDDPDAFKRLIQKFGFREVTGLWSSHGAIIPDPQSVEYVVRCIRWAAAAHIPVVHAADGFKPPEASEEDAFQTLREKLLQIVAAAEASKVYLAIEPHGTFSLATGGLKKILSISSSPWLGVNYDAANIHRAGYVETVEGAFAWKATGPKQAEAAVLAEVVERVVHFHAKDVRGSAAVALGTGEVDNEGCLRLLRKAGYQGAVSLETEGETTGEAALALIRESRQYLIRLMEKL
jgi:myo-inositol catabolism protein IolH